MDAVVSDGSSTLFYASLEEKVEIVELLIAHGAEVNEEGQTAPHWSAQNGHIKVAKALLTHAADLKPVDSDKALPLPWAGAEGHKDMEFFVSAESAKVAPSIGKLGTLCRGMSVLLYFYLRWITPMILKLKFLPSSPTCPLPL